MSFFYSDSRFEKNSVEAKICRKLPPVSSLFQWSNFVQIVAYKLLSHPVLYDFGNAPYANVFRIRGPILDFRKIQKLRLNHFGRFDSEISDLKKPILMRTDVRNFTYSDDENFRKNNKNSTKTKRLWIISLALASVHEGCFYLEIYSLTILLQFLIPKINN